MFESLYKLCQLYDVLCQIVCLSFTILNIFENKKGIIKILVYSSVNGH